MHFKLLFPGDYLGAHDLGEKEFTLTIAEVVNGEELKMEGGKSEKKPVLKFAKAKKKLVLNKTNAKAIAKQHGPDTDAWIGKSITVYATTCKLGRETVECVRVKAGASHRPSNALQLPEGNQ